MTEKEIINLTELFPREYKIGNIICCQEIGKWVPGDLLKVCLGHPYPEAGFMIFDESINYRSTKFDILKNYFVLDTLSNMLIRNCRELNV